MRQLKAIIFDIDGVLVDSRNANVAFFNALLKKAGHPEASREEILAHFHIPLWQSLQKLLKTNDEHQIQPLFEMANDPQLRSRELLEFPPRLESILETLHKKYRLAIVTSRIKVGVDDIFIAKNIRHLFDVVVAFEDYKHPKPHPEPLQLALVKLQLTADEAIYIGDSPTDIEAAKAAGMKSIFLSPTSHNDAAARIQELHELEDVLENF